MNNLKYKLEPLKISDGKKLKDWTSYESPLFLGYNYNNLSDKEIILWFASKQPRFNSSYFSIYVEDDLIGYIGLKEINKYLKTAKLGVVFDSKWTSKGYGSLVMKDFLDYCFKELKFRRIDLEVNSWNHRALRLYEKFGFKYNSTKYLEFENQELNLEDEKFKKYSEDFLFENGKIHTKIYVMKLKRQEYLDEI